ncbi:hypothetical protein [Gorillibacterium sp. sgz5001074]|uniref:hypothetical protein n=1 Tax=Gorillibacterium sp. sgz5001074 TaxID=3446695 RepID=UPI003F67C28E
MKLKRKSKRHYKNIERKIDCFKPDFELSDWYNFWHWHLDGWGYSELSNKHRRNHLKYYVMILNKIKSSELNNTKPFQTWIHIDLHSPTCDALFIHTENPNTTFPYIPDKIIWNEKAPDLFKGIIELNTYDIGKYMDDDGRENSYLIAMKELGTSLRGFEEGVGIR